MTPDILAHCEKQMEHYSRVINKKVKSGKINAEKSRRLFAVLDRWFETLDSHWDSIENT